MDVAVVVVIIVALLGSFPGRLSEIPEPIGDFSEVPEIEEAYKYDPTVRKGKRMAEISTYIPISSARAERSSIDGLEVRVNRSFSASS
jgi:hypothetical protein